MGMGGLSGAYHSFDGVAAWAGDGYTSAAAGGVVPALEREGRAEEVAGEGVAGERAGSGADVAAEVGGFAGVGVGGTGGSGRGCSGFGGGAGGFDGGLGCGGLLGGALRDWRSGGLNNDILDC